jgi:SAM-dependent methyltransferase
MYAAKFAELSPHVTGVEIDPAAADQARARVLHVVVAPARVAAVRRRLVRRGLSHEVIEHVDDDRPAAAEMVRVLAPGGRIVLFCPNRLYPFETHGHYWRGKYRFGNTPLINWLPNPLRNRLAPHVRAYTRGGIRKLFAGQPVRIIHHTVIYPGFDNIVARRPLHSAASCASSCMRWSTRRCGGSG